MSPRRARSTRDANLSGAWSGVYSYAGNMQMLVPFSAKLTQKGRWIVGATKEEERPDATAIAATLQGRRDGANVTWLKLYDRPRQGYDEVAYDGQVNEEATEISGLWRIPGDGSGTFLMIRTATLTLARQTETEEGM